MFQNAQTYLHFHINTEKQNNNRRKHCELTRQYSNGENLLIHSRTFNLIQAVILYRNTVWKFTLFTQISFYFLTLFGNERKHSLALYEPNQMFVSHSTCWVFFGLLSLMTMNLKVFGKVTLVLNLSIQLCIGKIRFTFSGEFLSFFFFLSPVKMHFSILFNHE